MKALLSAFLALALVAVLTGEADAASRKKKKKYRSYDAPYSQSQGRRLYSGVEDGSYFERRLDAVPFGSPRWWQVYNDLNAPRR